MDANVESVEANVLLKKVVTNNQTISLFSKIKQSTINSRKHARVKKIRNCQARARVKLAKMRILSMFRQLPLNSLLNSQVSVQLKRSYC
jgi:ribosomal protein L10